MSALFYKVVYRLGFTPWERLETLPAARQALAMLDRAVGVTLERHQVKVQR